jgi:penicillin-binding protein 2
LQVNAWTQAIANRGTLYKPHLLMNHESPIINQDFLQQKTVALIKEGMTQSCEEGGVAWPLFNFKVKNKKLPIDDKNIFQVQVSSSSATPSAQLVDYRHVSIACKTGTAQHGDEHTKPHSWITLFAPAENPQIVVTVLAESSGEGSNVAGPIAKKILEDWFSR